MADSASYRLKNIQSETGELPCVVRNDGLYLPLEVVDGLVRLWESDERGYNALIEMLNVLLTEESVFRGEA